MRCAGEKRCTSEGRHALAQPASSEKNERTRKCNTPARCPPSSPSCAWAWEVPSRMTRRPSYPRPEAPPGASASWEYSQHCRTCHRGPRWCPLAMAAQSHRQPPSCRGRRQPWSRRGRPSRRRSPDGTRKHSGLSWLRHRRQRAASGAFTCREAGQRGRSEPVDRSGEAQHPPSRRGAVLRSGRNAAGTEAGEREP